MIATRGKFVTEGSFLGTPSWPWIDWRAMAGEDQAAAYDLTADDMSFATLFTNEKILQVTDGVIDLQHEFGNCANGLQFQVYGDHASNADNDTFAFEIFAWKAIIGEPKCVCRGTGILGTNLVSTNPVTGVALSNGLWADTIALSDYWPQGITVEDSGNDQIASVIFDTMGFRIFSVNIYNCLGGTTGGEAHEIGVIVSAY